MSLWIKICGITCPDDAELAALAGADAIGLNLVPSSKRFVSENTAREIAGVIAGRAEVVLVVADQSTEGLLGLRERVGVRWLQLHGTETPQTLALLLPEAMKALRISDLRDVAAAAEFGGERLLVDAKVAGELGGTGRSLDPSLVVDLARARRIVLAGGLTSDTVTRAVRRVRPWGIDVASGVEDPRNPRRKQPELLRHFIEAARASVVSWRHHTTR